jgi:hypothetical protein
MNTALYGENWAGGAPLRLTKSVPETASRPLIAASVFNGLGHPVFRGVHGTQPIETAISYNDMYFLEGVQSVSEK